MAKVGANGSLSPALQAIPIHFKFASGHVIHRPCLIHCAQSLSEWEPALPFFFSLLSYSP